MKLKNKLLAMACMAVIIGATTESEAAERLSVHEVNNFIGALTKAVNTPDPLVGSSFLKRNISANARFDTTISSAWANAPYYHQQIMHANPDGTYYYRYPYHGQYYRPTSIQGQGKWEAIGQFESKKISIPGYQQKIKTTNINMPANALSAVVDLELSEYGVHYVSGYYYPYHLRDRKQAFSRCKMYLSKTGGDVVMTRMDCNKVQYSPL